VRVQLLVLMITELPKIADFLKPLFNALPERRVVPLGEIGLAVVEASFAKDFDNTLFKWQFNQLVIYILACP